MGSLFELEGDRLTVVSVDGYRLALRRADVAGKTQSARFIVPGTVLQDVSRLCSKGDEEVMINLGERHVSFSLGDTVVFSRLLEGGLPQLPQDHTRELPSQARRAARRDALRDRPRQPRRGRDGEEPDPPHLRRREHRFPLQHRPRRGDGRLHLHRLRRGHGDRLQRPLLRDALRAAPADELTVCINTGSAPCVILPADGSDGFVYMVLPVRLAK